MKKTLAIVLALVMVLAMIPAMSAATLTKIESNANQMVIVSVANDATTGKMIAPTKGTMVKGNSYTFKYDFEKEVADVTDKWAENKKMALVQIGGWDAALTAQPAKKMTVTVDDKEINVGSADYAKYVGAQNESGKFSYVAIPVELTKEGYTDSMLVTVTYVNGDHTITQDALVSIKMVNTAEYKGAETAVITDIASTNARNASAYIVGSKIYVDYVEQKAAAELKVTFADENGAAFTAITYAYNPVVKQDNGTYKVETDKVSIADTTKANAEVRLDKSAAKFDLQTLVENKNIKFKLETKAANYETKAYDVVMREYIVEEDPKGIYFAETTKTIAMGKDVYTPVVMGVKTGKPVAATLNVPADTDKQVVDIINNGKSVIGTREGVAYITATYAPIGLEDTKGKQYTYTSSSMKIIVTLPGESIPEVKDEATVYYVTCRALNVRAGAGTSYKKVDLLKRGEAVKVVKIAGGWAELADGTYVCEKYIAK